MAVWRCGLAWKSEHGWCSVLDAVRDAEVVLAPDVVERLKWPEPEPLTEEQVRRRLAIRAKAAEDAYRRMVENVSQQSAFGRAVGGPRQRHHMPHSFLELEREEQEERVRGELRLMTSNSYLAINLVVAMAACFVVGFYLGRTMWPASRQARWVCGAVGLVGALFVESVLLIIKLARQDSLEARKIREASTLRAQRAPVRPTIHEIPVPGAGSSSSRSKKDKSKDE